MLSLIPHLRLLVVCVALCAFRAEAAPELQAPLVLRQTAGSLRGSKWTSFQKAVPKPAPLLSTGLLQLNLDTAKDTAIPPTVTRRDKSILHPGCKKLLWFTAVAAKADGTVPAMYEAAIITSTMSALRMAPSLTPHLIFDGPAGTLPPVVQWFARMGGTVHRHSLSFRSSIEASVKAGYHPKSWLAIQGTFLRIDLPLILANVSIPPDTEHDYLLYTDTDVLFQRPVDSCSFPKPRNVLMGAECCRGLIANAGVMYLNVSSFRQHHRGLVAWGDTHHWPQQADQTLLLEYFKDGQHGGLQLLDDAFNWKGYWGPANSSSSGTEVAIVHFHGPKPMRCLECFILHSSNIDYCAKKNQACDAYAPFWRNAPDKGEYLGELLAQFYMYLGLATSPVL